MKILYEWKNKRVIAEAGNTSNGLLLQCKNNNNEWYTHEWIEGYTLTAEFILILLEQVNEKNKNTSNNS